MPEQGMSLPPKFVVAINLVYGGLLVLSGVAGFFLMQHAFAPIYSQFGGQGSRAPEVQAIVADQRFIDFLFGATGVFGALSLLAAYCLARGIGKPLIWAVAVLECVNVPLGTIVGLFTIVALMQRPSLATFAPPLPAGSG